MLSPQEITLIMNDTKVFLNPTKVDTYGMANIEALCAGIPVVSSAIMGIPYVISDGVNGYLLRSDDEQGFIDKTTILLTKDELRTQMAQNAKMMASQRWSDICIGNEFSKMYTLAMR